MKFETAVDALRAFCSLSKGGTESVTTDMLGVNLGLSAATAGLNNMWFKEIGLITTASKGAYKPTSTAMEFYNKYSFDKDAAPRLLAPAVKSGWFYDVIEQRLDIIPTATRKQIIETLAAHAGTDATYSAQYGQILEWLKFVGLIVVDGDTVLLADEPPTGDSAEDDDTFVEEPPKARNSGIAKARVTSGATVVSMTFEVSVTAEDLSMLDPEQIASLFDGIGKVAAVKATLHKD
jgi:hypothetical protein